jgi:hypothetical protein
MVVTDDDALARVLAAHNVSRDGVSHDPRIGKREIFRDYAAPAVGSKFDCRDQEVSISEGASSETAALA